MMEIRWGFRIGFSGRVVGYLIAHQETEGDGISVVMICSRVFLMGVTRIEGDTLIHVSVTVPESAALRFGAAVPIKGVATIEHGHAIDKVTDRAKSSECFGGGHRGGSWDAIEGLFVDRQIREKHGFAR